MKRKILKKMLIFGFVDKTAHVRMIRFPPSKINIGLYVTGRRPDGFHNLESLFYPLPFRDILEIVETSPHGRNHIQLKLSGLPLEGDLTSNLVVRAYELIAADFNLPAVEVYLHKVIPGGSGLGGGSSDGAAMILMLNELAGLDLDQSRIESYAARLGSDCPFFIRGEPALVRGRGEVLEASGINLKGMYMLLFRPEDGISTAEAYRHVSIEDPPFSLRNLRGREEPERLRALSNAFEPFAREKIPMIGRLLDQLRKSDAICAFLTGSGSAVYGLYSHSVDPPSEFSEYLIWSGWL